jgi:hypothetical protein
MTFIAGSIAGVWGSIFLLFDLSEVAIIAYSYFSVSYLGLIDYRIKNRIIFLKNSQFVLSLILPFFATIIMGGFISSGVVIVWSLFTPFGAIIFSDYKNAIVWYISFVILLIFGGVIGYTTIPRSILPEIIIQLFFILNLIGITGIIFFVFLYFVTQKVKAINLLRTLAQKEFSKLIDNLNIDEKQIGKSKFRSTPVLFMILNENGVAVFSKIFGNEKKFDNQLIGGFLTAINAMGQGAFGAKILQEISYKDFFLFFEIVKNKRVVYAFGGDYISGKTRFNELIKNLQNKEYEFIYDLEWTIVNADFKLNNLVTSIFENSINTN